MKLWLGKQTELDETCGMCAIFYYGLQIFATKLYFWNTFQKYIMDKFVVIATLQSQVWLGVFSNQWVRSKENPKIQNSVPGIEFKRAFFYALKMGLSHPRVDWALTHWWKFVQSFYVKSYATKVNLDNLQF